MTQTDTRLIEAGFPCHQVGAETQRERGASSALPPLYFLHVWWARRPLTPSRAAILASLLPADTDADWFLRQLGIEKVQAMVNGRPWTLTEDTHFRRVTAEGGAEVFTVDRFAVNWLKKEQERRSDNRKLIADMLEKDASLAQDPVMIQWQEESRALPEPLPAKGAKLPVRRIAADPAHVNERLAFAKSDRVKRAVGGELRWDKPDLYGYDRAYTHHPALAERPLVVLDPTAGGGSIPFEALRLGHKVIANDLNPVATVIQYATLDYPARFGPSLADDIQMWGTQLVEYVGKEMADLTPFSPLPESERQCLRAHCQQCPDLIPFFDKPEIHQTGLLYVRQVTCPHCGGEAPLLNTCWLSKVEGDEWGVQVVVDGKAVGGKVRFETYRCDRGKGPNGEDPEFATVYRGDGICVHCKQKIGGDEIKQQACGESDRGKWVNRLYCVVGVRRQPRLDANGRPQRDGDQQIKTEKVTFFRPPNSLDLEALEIAARRCAEMGEQLERGELIPTEEIPPGHRSVERDIIFQYGVKRWVDMFTPRQLLGHAASIKKLKELSPKILADLGDERGKAVVTYLQFAIDKLVDYNSTFTRWITQRCSVSGTFGRHDFSLKWTFGEMIFSGASSGAVWALSQIVDAYTEIEKLVNSAVQSERLTILHGSAARLESLNDEYVDCVCMDPPYYNNVQYAELSDFYYVWQKRTLQPLYSDVFQRRLTNKRDEAVANPHRDGGESESEQAYLRLMREIFVEAHRVLKANGLMTLMFTHKEQSAWNALTRSLIESGWTIQAAIPVDSEFANSQNIMETASAETSIFIACRKRPSNFAGQATWTGIGGTGVQQRIQAEVRAAIKQFEKLRLNPVDEMVAGYGRALRVLSEQWPVLDGDEQVSPIQAMAEASRVVAQYQITRLTGGRLQVNDLNPEAAVALTVYGIYGLGEIPFDDFRNLCNSLNIERRNVAGGYAVEDRTVGINPDTQTRRRSGASQDAEAQGYNAPIVSKGNKLRLARPDERSAKRLDKPQTEWDILHGLLDANTRGELVVARDYLNTHAGSRREIILDLLTVWAKEMLDEKLRKDAETLLFGLKSS